MWCPNIAVGSLAGQMSSLTSQVFLGAQGIFTSKVAQQFLAMDLGSDWSLFEAQPSADALRALTWHVTFQQRFCQFAQSPLAQTYLDPEPIARLQSIQIDEQGRVNRDTAEAILKALLAVSTAGINPFFHDLGRATPHLVPITRDDLLYFQMLYGLEMAHAIKAREGEVNIIGTDTERSGFFDQEVDRIFEVDPNKLKSFLAETALDQATLLGTLDEAQRFDDDATRIATAIRDLDRLVAAPRLFSAVTAAHSIMSVGFNLTWPPHIVVMGMPGDAIETLLQHPDSLYAIDGLYIKMPHQLEGALAVAREPRLTSLRSLRIRAPKYTDEADRLTDDQVVTLAEALSQTPWIENLRLLNLRGHGIGARSEATLRSRLPEDLNILLGPSLE